METTNSTGEVVNCVNFNQTGTCISLGTSKGYDIFNCNPFGKFFSESEPDTGGYSIVEMLFSTSLVVLVGNGDSPHLSPRKLRLVNTKKHSIICEITFPTSILSVKMNKSRLVVLLSLQIYIYDINNMTLLHVIDREANQTNLINVSPDLENNILVYPSTSKLIHSDIRTNVTSNNMTLLNNKLDDPLAEDQIGNNIDTNLDIDDYEDDDGNVGSDGNDSNDGEEEDEDSNNVPKISDTGAEHFINQYNSNNSDPDNDDKSVKNGDVILFDMDELQPMMIIEAHKNGIAALAISPDGQYLATASEKGTIIRIFSVITGFKLYQFRRGTYSTKIYSMNFSEDNQFLLASSSSKTVHVFKLGNMVSNTGSASDNEGEISKNNEIDETGSNSSGNTGNYIDKNSLRKPYVDASRKTVARMIRNSSQTFTRRAAQTLGQIFPQKVTSILEPSRHFASLKIPVKDDTDSHVRSIAFIGGTIEISVDDYPELFSNCDNDDIGITKNGNLVGIRTGIHGNRAFQKGHKNTSENVVKPNIQDGTDTIAMLVIRIVTTEGYFFNYVLDPKRGGDCLLLSQYSLLDS